MNRIDRISAMLIHLQSRRIVKASDLAERFNISLRTVYRDIRTLEEAGVPIIGEAGIGYSILQGYHLPPVMFNKEEVMALLTAEKLASLLTDTSTGRYLDSAMTKIRAILKNNEKAIMETLDDKIAVLPNPYRPDEWRDSTVLKDIITSIDSKSILEIEYNSNHSLETNKRQIEPVGMWFQSGRWHLIAWCRLRNDYRNFRIDRIIGHRVLEEYYKTVHPKLEQFMDKTIKEQQLIEVVLRMKMEDYKSMGDQKLFMGFVSQKLLENGEVEMRFLSPSENSMARWIMMLGDEVNIVSPDSLKAKVRKMAEGFLSRL